MQLNIQLIDEDHNILIAEPASYVKINGVTVSNLGLSSEYTHTFAANDLVKIEINYYGRNPYVNTFKLPNYDLGNSVASNVTDNTPFTIMLPLIRNVERTQRWKQDTIYNIGEQNLYWDNLITLINPVPFVNKTFTRINSDNSVNPPVMVLKNRITENKLYYYGIRITPMWNNDLSLNVILDNDGNVVTLINGNIVITGNPVYDYKFIFPHFIVYKDLITTELYFYNATSSIRDKITYTIDDKLIGIGENIIKDCKLTGCDLIGRQTITLTLEDECGCCGAVVVYSEYDEHELCIEEYLNDMTVSLVQNKHCATEDCEYNITGEPITVRASITVKTPYVKRNNVCTPYCPNGTVTFERYDKDGELIDTKIVNVVYDRSICHTAVVIAEYTFTIDTPTEERVIVTYEDCYNKCVKEEIINFCNAYRVLQQDCNVFVLENCSIARTMTVNITNSGTGGVLVANDSLAPAATRTYNLNNGEDGTYIVTITDDTRTVIYPIYNFCNVRKCAMTALSSVLCKPCDTANCSEENKHDFRKMFLFGLMYFNYVEKDLALNYAYTALNNELSNDIQEANKWLMLLKQLCEDLANCGGGVAICGCNDTPTLNHCKTC